MKPVGVIGGSGSYELLENPKMFVHNNKYGRSLEIFERMIQGCKVYFLPRREEKHKVIVSRINYRTSIWAFRELRMEQILVANCMGSNNPGIELGSLVIPHNLCDWTRRFPCSLYGDEVGTYHVDTAPAHYPDLGKTLIQAANQVGPGYVHDQVMIFVSKGLGFGTPFKLEVFRKSGADLIGMATLPEVVFIRETVICYTYICVPTNWCLGEQIRADDFSRLLKRGIEDFKQVLYLVIPTLPDDRDCPCSHVLGHAILGEWGVE